MFLKDHQTQDLDLDLLGLVQGDSNNNNRSNIPITKIDTPFPIDARIHLVQWFVRRREVVRAAQVLWSNYTKEISQIISRFLVRSTHRRDRVINELLMRHNRVPLADKNQGTRFIGKQ